MVTGATGFFGSHLCRRLRDTGAEIYAVSRNAREDAGAGFRWLQADLNDISAVRRMLLEVRPDVVFHLSGIATADVGLELVLPTFHALLVSTVNLLTVAAEIGIPRVILAGSLQEPKPDDADPTPSSPYAAAKWASSAYGRMVRRIYGVACRQPSSIPDLRTRAGCSQADPVRHACAAATTKAGAFERKVGGGLDLHRRRDQRAPRRRSSS